jgi:hypothetical protein
MRLRPSLSPRGRRLLEYGLAACGFLLLAVVLLERGILGAGNGAGGGDALAYQAAAQRMLDGAPLYIEHAGTLLAFVYPPLFAQLIAPLGLLSPVAFVWLWRGFGLLGLRVAMGSWTAAGIATLVFPPVIFELEVANLNLVLAGICAMVMRGQAALVLPAFVAKLAALPLLPLAAITDRRGLLAGGLAAGIAVTVSVLTVPQLWGTYVQFLASSPEPSYWTNLFAGVPIVARLLAALLLGVVAIRYRRVAPVAMLVGLPVVWLSALSILVATAAPLPGEARRRVRTPLIVPEPA